MRIIKEEGREVEEKETNKSCYKCLTKFAYLSSDIEVDRDGRYVRCPHCKAFIAVK